jgi:hypothetical protein
LDHQKIENKGWGMSQAVEHLPNKHKALLSSNPNITKKKLKTTIHQYQTENKL